MLSIEDSRNNNYKTIMACTALTKNNKVALARKKK